MDLHAHLEICYSLAPSDFDRLGTLERRGLSILTVGTALHTVSISYDRKSDLRISQPHLTACLQSQTKKTKSPSRMSAVKMSTMGKSASRVLTTQPRNAFCERLI